MHKTIKILGVGSAKYRSMPPFTKMKYRMYLDNLGYACITHLRSQRLGRRPFFKEIDLAH